MFQIDKFIKINELQSQTHLFLFSIFFSIYLGIVNGY